ncbi:uncharacterized protein LOC131148967 isoform X2 [Malania oleifera]|uniref:uncharacterized protein LOC131148967 isoform X2 n=1 Tax=Malania oleifera TaxID=397392 RepID=UPI0025AE42C8|nr:uncharacterized protein LOC131148967 isoform X2 [Malania oleifera]
MAKPRRVCSLLLRILALGATVSATILMVTSHQTVFRDCKCYSKRVWTAGAIPSFRESAMAISGCPRRGFWHVVSFQCIGCLGSCVRGEEREFSCRLATHLRPGSQVLRPCDGGPGDWLHRTHTLCLASPLLRARCA